jgi:hypothetical protein
MYSSVVTPLFDQQQIPPIVKNHIVLFIGKRPSLMYQLIGLTFLLEQIPQSYRSQTYY